MEEKTMLRLVDTHCHIDLYPNSKQVVEMAERSCVYTIAVTNAPFVFPHTRELTFGKKFVRAAIGLHPELVAEHASELPQMLQFLRETRYVGEVGLDYTVKDEVLRRKQRDVFQAIMNACTEDQNKILTVHSRRAVSDVLACVGKDFPGTIILHWFSGTPRELAAALAVGCYFSVNPAMCTSMHGRKIISKIPRDHVLTETDGPFVTLKSRPAEPADVQLVTEVIADLWKISTGEVQRVVFDNFKRILGDPLQQNGKLSISKEVWE